MSAVRRDIAKTKPRSSVDSNTSETHQNGSFSIKFNWSSNPWSGLGVNLLIIMVVVVWIKNIHSHIFDVCIFNWLSKLLVTRLNMDKKCLPRFHTRRKQIPDCPEQLTVRCLGLCSSGRSIHSSNCAINKFFAGVCATNFRSILWEGRVKV